MIKQGKINQELTIQLIHLYIFAKWLLLAGITGLLVGGVGALFSFCLSFVTNVRLAHPEMIYGLPVAGLIIVGMYHASHHLNTKGTNLVIGSVRSDEAIPAIMAPLIFISTALTHLFGGSAGREGAALQLGGSIGQNLGRCLHLNEKDTQLMTMCAMSAAFAALFGTPLTATVFSMEVISVGIMHYAALVPCSLASIIAAKTAQACGIHAEAFTIAVIPDLNITVFIRVMIFAALLAYVSIFFCYIMHQTHHIFAHYFKNPYVRIAVGGCLIILLTGIFGSDYNGAGMPVIQAAIEQGTVKPEAFFLKLVFTAITLAAGYKGGEIVPCFFVGATFGCTIAPLLGLPASFGAALGLMILFCGVTNCPMTALLLSFELFGFQALPLFLISDAIGYMLSGYYGLYSEQKIMYSKFTSRYIDAHANKHVD